jgi:pyruvate formate lyase activating enzyme
MYIPPEEVVTIAKLRKCKSISFTYSEPNVFYEYVLDIAKLAQKEGIKTVMVTAGFINEEPLKELLKYIDAANIDFKGDENFYQEMCNATLSPIKRTIKIYKESDIHIEITNLIIPTKNDSLPIIRKMCKWIKTEIGENTPLHFSRFFPHYKVKNLPPTPLETLKKAYKIAKKEGLNYVYIGNVRTKYENTYCHKCNKILVERIGYFIQEINIKDGKCRFCKSSIPGVWN